MSRQMSIGVHQALKLVKQGMSIRDAAKVAGCTARAISYALARAKREKATDTNKT